MWLGSPQQLAKVNVSDVTSTRINASETVRDLGVVIDSQLSLSTQVAAVCVAVAITSYGNSDHSSDLCRPRP